jgi:hypothetical protein
MLDQAIRIYHKFGDTYNWANSMDNLADLYEAQGKMNLQRKTLENALATLSTIEPSPHVQMLLQAMRQRLT